jgi:hypothetical protein
MIRTIQNIPVNKHMLDEFIVELNKHMYRLSRQRRLDGGFSEVSVVGFENGIAHLAWRDGHQWLADPHPESVSEYETMDYVCRIPLRIIENESLLVERKLQLAAGKWKQIQYRFEEWGNTGRSSVCWHP